jgi:endonuclease IV
MSFDAVVPYMESMDTTHVRGAKFPVGLKKKLYEIDEGSIVTFLNVKVLMPKNKVAIIPSISVFVAKTDQFSVGQRPDMIDDK